MVLAAVRSASKALVAAVLLGLTGGVVLILALSSPERALGQTACPDNPGETGPEIEWVNPTGNATNTDIANPSTEISDKERPVHLNTWVNSATAANAIVEFEYQSTASGSQAFSIGTATKRGSDAFDFFWSIPDSLADEDLILRARLFVDPGSGFQQIDCDEQTVRVNQATPSQTPPTDPYGHAAETVEITSPANGAQWGVFPGPSSSQTSTGVVDVAFSAGLSGSDDRVRVFFSRSTPGAAPTWEQCGTEDATAAANGVPCTVPPGGPVTALAAVALDSVGAFPGSCPSATDTSPPCDDKDGGDAHRVSSYDQQPTTVSLNPSSQAPATGSCSSVITTKVTDQNNQKIARINVDVHATGSGTNDILHFDRPAVTPDPYKEPDQGGHSTESAFNCAGNNFSTRTQGEHNVPNAPDVKHIESSTGTNDAGEFTFRLWSSQTGTATVTAWADFATENDAQDSEPSGSATVNFGGTASPSPTMTSPSPTQTMTATTTGPPPGGFTVTVSLEASRNKTRFGKVFTLTGSLTRNQSNAPSSCIAGRQVILDRTITGTTAATEVARTTSDSNGVFSFTRTADKSANYVARVEQRGDCAPGSSDPEQVNVKKAVTLDISDRSVAKGTRVKFTVIVAPCAGHEGDVVSLWKTREGELRKVDTQQTSNSCRTTFTKVIKRTSKWQARSPKQDADHLAGRSSTQTVRAR